MREAELSNSEALGLNISIDTCLQKDILPWRIWSLNPVLEKENSPNNLVKHTVSETKRFLPHQKKTTISLF